VKVRRKLYIAPIQGHLIGANKVCGPEKSLRDIVDIALKCEANGGLPHEIFEVREITGWRGFSRLHRTSIR